MLLVVYAAFADWGDPFDQVLGQGGFAFDADDGGGCAAGADPVEAAGVAFGSGEEFVPVVDGADVGVAGVGAAFASGVGDHDFGFGADVGVGFGEGDGVVVGLGHFATIEAWDAGGGGEEVAGFGEYVIELNKFTEMGSFPFGFFPECFHFVKSIELLLQVCESARLGEASKSGL